MEGIADHFPAKSALHCRTLHIQSQKSPQKRPLVLESWNPDINFRFARQRFHCFRTTKPPLASSSSSSSSSCSAQHGSRCNCSPWGPIEIKVKSVQSCSSTFNGGSKTFERGSGMKDIYISPSSFIANAHDAFYTGKRGLLKKIEPIGGGERPTTPPPESITVSIIFHLFVCHESEYKIPTNAKSHWISFIWSVDYSTMRQNKLKIA